MPDESGLERYVTVTYKPYGEYFTLRPGTLKWVDSPPVTPGVSMNYGAPLILATIQLTLTWHLVPKFKAPLETISASLGKINDDEFAGFNENTLLLLSADLRPVRSAFGDRLVDITYFFKYFQPISGGHHNYFLRPKTDTDLIWNLATRDGKTTGGRAYDSVDFKKLFRPE